MQIKSGIAAVFIAAVLATSACNKDDDVNETLSLLDKHGKEIANKVKSAEDKKAGVADAQKYLDANKDDLKKRIGEMAELRGFQVSEEAQQKMATGLIDAVFACGSLKMDLMAETMSDKDLETALDKLCKDWEGVLESATE